MYLFYRYYFHSYLLHKHMHHCRQVKILDFASIFRHSPPPGESKIYLEFYRCPTKRELTDFSTLEMHLSRLQAIIPNQATLLTSLLSLHDTLSFGEAKISESSVETERYALATACKAARNFKLLIHDFLPKILVMNLRCDNTATVAMLEEPVWRSRYISTYGEAARQEMLSRTLTVTHVPTALQLTDPTTKPPSTLLNSDIFHSGILSALPRAGQSDYFSPSSLAIA